MNQGPKRFTPATFILVVLLVGSVIGISLLVNPKPALPEAPPSPEMLAIAKQKSDADAQGQKDEMMKKMKDEQVKMQQAKTMVKQLNTPVVNNPDAIEVKNTFFLTHAPGKAGQEQVATELVDQKAKFKVYQEVVKKMRPSN